MVDRLVEADPAQVGNLLRAAGDADRAAPKIFASCPTVAPTGPLAATITIVSPAFGRPIWVRPAYAAKPRIPRTPSAVVTGALPGSSLRTVEPFCTPYFCHPVYGVQLWMPEAGGRVDYASEHDERAMTVLGLSSKREITRTSIRVRTAMGAQTREQGRYLGGRPPYGTGWPMPGRIRIRRMPPGDPRSPAGVRPADGACRAVDFHAAARGPFGGADRAGAKRGGDLVPVSSRP